MKEAIFTESDLNTNLNELAHDALRELLLASKKISIYSGAHPLTQKAIANSFILMEKIFKFKKYLSLHLSSEYLFVLNIRIKQSIFTDQFVDYMRAQDINDILFEAGLTMDQLAEFLDGFINRLPSASPKDLMVNFFENNRIDMVHINTQLGKRLFEKGYHFIGDREGDFSVRNIISQIIGDDFENLAGFLANESSNLDHYISRHNIDFYPALVTYLVPEKIASIKYDDIINLLSGKLISAVEGKKSIEEIDKAKLEEFQHLFTALSYHSRREEIIEQLGMRLLKRGMEKDIYIKLLPQTSSFSTDSSQKIDQFLHAAFNQTLPEDNLDEFENLFIRLIRTGQQGKVKSVIDELIDYLAGPDLDIRKKALVLFRSTLSTCSGTANGFLIEYLISKIDEYITEAKETFEFSDLIWELAKITLLKKDYLHLSSICDVLSEKRTRHQGVLSYESVAIKKSVEELNRQEVISRLIYDLVNGRHSNIQYIKNILITIGSEEAALALSNIISHESRQVRMHVLKILSEMGKSSLRVFTEILKDDTYFVRDKGKRELPDEKWYIIRNSIFVLGSLEDPEACRALRLRANDDDTRIGHVIIQALEKIGGEQAADLLLILADGLDHEIREAAIIALGFTGTADIVPELIDLADRQKPEIATIITTVGMLGGDKARSFLSDLLADRQLQARYAPSRSTRDDLKLAAIKALGRIGDNESIERIRKFSESITATQRLFFGQSKLNKAAEEILNRQGS